MANKSHLTDEMKSKIKDAAALDCSVEEMAYLCDVTKQTIYNWFKEDPALFDEVQRLREKPVYKARLTVIEKMEESYGNAMDYLKRKKKKEFGDNIDVTSDGEGLKTINVIKYSDNQSDAETN